MFDLEKIEGKIKKYFEEDSYFKEFLPDVFSSMTSLADLGMFDSLSIVNVISFLEEEFSIRFQVNDITEENFLNISKLAKYVEDKLKIDV